MASRHSGSLYFVGDDVKSAIHRCDDRRFANPSCKDSRYRSCSEATVQHRRIIAGKHLILLTSDRGRPSLVADLTAAGAIVESVAIYSYGEDFPDLSLQPKAVVFPSSSAVELLIRAPYANSLRALPAIAMGKRTLEADNCYGVFNVMQATRDTVESVVTGVTDLFLGGRQLNLNNRQRI